MLPYSLWMSEPQFAYVEIAHACGVRRLVLTHFSQRYTDSRRYRDEATEEFDGDLIIAEDLERIAVPGRVDAPPGR